MNPDLPEDMREVTDKMLVSALALTLVGFVFLAAVLWTGNLVFAWMCIAACAVGAIILILDIIRPGNNERHLADCDPEQSDDDPHSQPEPRADAREKH